MTSCRLVRESELQDVAESSEMGTPVAIQWQNSDHLGLPREGASGSVMVTVYVILERVLQGSDDDDSGRRSVMDGASCIFFGFNVFPSWALLFKDHFASRSSEGRKSSMTEFGSQHVRTRPDVVFKCWPPNYSNFCNPICH